MATAVAHQPKNASIEKFFQTLIAPQRIALIIFGLYENYFSKKAARVAYFIYSLLILGIFGYATFALFHIVLDDLGIQCLEELVFKTDMDKFTYVVLEIIFLYKVIISFIFIVWIMKFRKLSSFANITQEDRFAALDDIIRHKRPIKRKYVILSYVSFAYFVIYGLIDLCEFRFYFHASTSGITYSVFDIVAYLIVSLCMAISIAVYLFIASLWDILNEDLLCRTKTRDNMPLDKLLDNYVVSYDVLTELTGKAAELFRSYTTIYVSTIVNFVALIYLASYVFMGGIFMNWIQTIIEIGGLWTAAYIHSCSGATAENLYKFYKSRSDNSTSGKLRQKFDAFYQRVAHEWAPVQLDIFGMCPINYATLGLSAFTVVNWIAVLLQFRQGASTTDLNWRSSYWSYCDNVRADMANKTFNSTS